MAYFFLAIALIGILGMTVLFPVLSVLFNPRRSYRPVVGNGTQPERILVAVPAHNEEKTIAGTLESILEAIDCYEHRFPGTTVEVAVGLDGCTDRTERLVRLFPGVTVVQSPTAQGKWKMMQQLSAAGAGYDWIVYADCGVRWPSHLLLGLAPSFADPDLVGINPTYRNPAGGLLETASWKIECVLKGLETRVSGPVSVHGATVAYRAHALRKVFRLLGKRQWHNDDVVVPMTLHMLFPENRFAYLSDIGVADAREAGVRDSSGAEYRRRLRMVAGNAQWIGSMLPRVWRRNHLAGMLAFRRVFRVLWAYWGLFLGFAGLGFIALYSFPAALVAAGIGIVSATALLYRSSSFRSLTEAALASLVAPYYLISGGRGDVAWR